MSCGWSQNVGVSRVGVALGRSGWVRYPLAAVSTAGSNSSRPRPQALGDRSVRIANAGPRPWLRGRCGAPRAPDASILALLRGVRRRNGEHAMTSTDRQYFRNMYAANNDPWNFETSLYERRKYALTLDTLTKERYHNAFEPGCSIGVLSELLAPD